jgi:hypothetical protein
MGFVLLYFIYSFVCFWKVCCEHLHRILVIVVCADSKLSNACAAIFGAVRALFSSWYDARVASDQML